MICDDCVASAAVEGLVIEGHPPVVAQPIFARWMPPVDPAAGMSETEYLMSSPANATELLESIAQADAGRASERRLIDPDAG